MTTEKVFELWCDSDFRDYVKTEADLSSQGMSYKYKEFVAHIWMRLSQTVADKTDERYRHLARCYAEEARRKHIEELIERKLR